jgi:hypothetical protein
MGAHILNKYFKPCKGIMNSKFRTVVMYEEAGKQNWRTKTYF